MSFKALAEIKINPDGTVTGKLLHHDLDGVSLIENGVYKLGFDTFRVELRVQYVGKQEGKNGEV